MIGLCDSDFLIVAAVVEGKVYECEVRGRVNVSGVVPPFAGGITASSVPL